MERIVDFHTYCPLCVHYTEPESCDACNECLNNAVNEDSRKPVNYQEKIGGSSHGE